MVCNVSDSPQKINLRAKHTRSCPMTNPEFTLAVDGREMLFDFQVDAFAAATKERGAHG
jgi:hypothetical protein